MMVKIKGVFHRFLSFLLSVLTVVMLVPNMIITAYAGNVSNNSLSGLTDTSITLTYDASTDDTKYAYWKASGDRIDGYVHRPGGSCNQAVKATLYIKNSKNTEAKLSFDYNITNLQGSVKIDGNSITSVGQGTYETTLQSGRQLSVYIATENKKDYKTIIEITNIQLIADSRPTTIFKPADHGIYTVDGTLITENTELKKESTDAYQLAATPDEGYQFLGWYNETASKYVKYDASCDIKFDTDQTITAVFVDATLGIFETGGQRFYNLNDANSFATAIGNGTITLVTNGNLSAGSYTISSGNTLLIPYDAVGTYNGTDEPDRVDTSYSKPSLFRKMTMSEGASIHINSGAKLQVGGRLNAASGADGAASSTTGAFGQIDMQTGSRITVDGTLCCYGYITGYGEVSASSSATIHEIFELREFRGGSDTLEMTTTKKGKKVFPVSQYYIQNIEVPLILVSGSTLKGHAAMYALSKGFSTSATLVGSDGLFQMGSNATLEKQYLPSEDRCCFKISGGEVSISRVSLELAGYPIDSADYVLPINGHIDIELCNNASANITNNVEFLPGVRVSIDSTSSLSIASGKNLYVYDSDEWGPYVYTSRQMTPSAFSPTREKTRSNADLTDVLMDVNGTITVNNGFYTTASGANIISSQGTGKIVMSNGASSGATLYQATQDLSFPEIPITSAQLHNADGSYTTTTDANSEDTYQICEYCHKWYKVGSHYTVQLYVDSNLSETMCSSTNSVTFSGVTSIIKSESNPACTINTSPDGLTVSGLTASVTEVKVWTQPVARIMSSDGNVIGQYVSLADAVDAYTGTGYIKMCDTSETGTISIDKDVYLDLNGQTVQADLTIGEGCTLYGMDCKTDDYDGSDAGKITGTVTGTGTVAPVFETDRKPDNDYNYHRYVSIQTDNVWSFHRFNISVNGYRFELSSITPECALFFLGKFRGDSTARDYLKSVGFTLSDSNGTIATPSFALPADASTIPVVATEDEASDSMVVFKAPDTYLFEAYLIRAFSKETPSTYQEQFGATATVTFNNGESWTSDKRDLSYLEAWQKVNASEIGDEDKARLNAFLKDLGEDPIS